MTQPKLDHMFDDEFTEAWCRRQFRGMEHWLARVVAEEAEHSKQVRQMRDELAKCREERARDAERIGELQGKLADLTERMNRMSEWAKKRKAEDGSPRTT